jgi:pyruvate kinase
MQGTPPGEERHDLAWDLELVARLAQELTSLRVDLIDLEEKSSSRLHALPGAQSASARNLLHYVALRRWELRDLQDALASLGLSSLGRAESCVLGTIEAVLKMLHHLLGDEEPLPGPHEPVLGFAEGRALLEAHTQLPPATPKNAEPSPACLRGSCTPR